MSLSLLSLCLALGADEPPSREAVIEREQQKAQAAVNAKYGNKKPTELSPEEREQLDKDQADAHKAVLEKNGIDPKQWARDSLKRGRAEYAKIQEQVKELAAKEKAAEEKKKAEANAPQEIQVQRGVTEDNPITLEEKPNEDGVVPVEKGLPPEAIDDQQAVSGEGAVDSAPAQKAPKPAKAAKGARRR